MPNYTMYKTSTCGACKLVEGTGVLEELNVKVINVDDFPLLKPEGMMGAPFFTKTWLGEGGSQHEATHTGFANKEILESL